MFDDKTLAFAIAQIGFDAKMESGELGIEAAVIGARLSAAAFSLPVDMQAVEDARREIASPRSDGLHLDAVRAAFRLFDTNGKLAGLAIAGAATVELDRQYNMPVASLQEPPEYPRHCRTVISMLVEAIARHDTTTDPFVRHDEYWWRVESGLELLGAQPLSCYGCAWIGKDEGETITTCRLLRHIAPEASGACTSFSSPQFAHGLFRDSGLPDTTFPSHGIYTLKPADEKYGDYNVYFAVEDTITVVVAKRGGRGEK